MKEVIETRFQELISEGQTLISEDFGTYGQVARNQNEKYKRWFFSVLNLLRVILPDINPYVLSASKLAIEDDRFIQETTVRDMFGVLTSAKEEWDRGLLRRIEYIVAASTFDDFLDHAEACHKSGQKEASGSLVSVVFEDTLKKIATKNSVDSTQDVEQIIHALVKKGVFTDVRSKRMQVASGLRNKALHSEWDQFDLSDVGTSIKIVRDLIDKDL